MRTIASFHTYQDAERAVDRLSDHGFPVERTMIVGRGLRYVERVTGRMTYAKAALSGALTGALVGALIAWLFVVFDWFSPIVARGWLVVDALWFGAIVGALFGVLAHALTGGRRDFTSISRMEADEYDVQVDEGLADEALRLLAGTEAGAVAAGEASDREARTGPPIKPSAPRETRR
jgi:hypothetical protein